MKTATIKKAYWQILETIGESTLVNAYFGGSNLTADYINEYSTNAVDGFLGDWIENNVNKNDLGDLSVSDILTNPDYLIQYAAGEFVSSFSWLFGCGVDGADSENVFRNCKKYFDAWGKFYLFARPFSNACTEYWLIRADSESSAYECLIAEFEKDFVVDENDAGENHSEFNDNGTAVNTDNLVLIGRICGNSK